ncbi:hypothetical protein NM208_g13336 [Fusarium decemcellulare]|uniref:Uncharacterized protein n=1 Tax=Fusarium decemcellulare TaxID=57161 RepID=A0ACC1RNQ8_9HYPO|nr:hypothetical protein NM208_g13336 [Fusarium decemcellulare]
MEYPTPATAASAPIPSQSADEPNGGPSGQNRNDAGASSNSAQGERVEDAAKAMSTLQIGPQTTPAIGPPLELFIDYELQPADTRVSIDDGYQMLCSYSWVSKQKEPEPTISVPGHLPSWRPLDFHLYPYIAPERAGRSGEANSSPVLEFPFDPVFKAMKVMNPAFKFDHVDILANRSSLVTLFAFCKRTNIKEMLRINLYMVRNTLVIERPGEFAKDSTTGQGIPDHRKFLEAHSPDNMSNAEGHHRVLRYQLGDLNCVVRTQADTIYTTTRGYHLEFQAGPVQESLADLRRLLEWLDIDDNGGVAVPGSTVGLIENGDEVLHSHVAEVTTSVEGYYNWRPAIRLPWLWFGRTPCLIHGSKSRGNYITKIDQHILHNDLRKWENNEHNEDALRNMVTLLHGLRAAAQRSKTGACVAICPRPRYPLHLNVFEMPEAKSPLPRATIEEFWS